MVIFEDLQKLFLYQRLNLGYECDICKRKFLDRFEHLQHISICKIEHLKCQKCGKVFGHPKILQLHMQFHNLNPPSPQEETDGEPSNYEKLNESEALSSSGTVEDNRVDQDITKATESNKDSQECHVVEAGNDKNSAEIVETRIFQQEPPVPIIPPKNQSSHQKIRRAKQAKKPVGLTKIRMEDCLRCDECSCIYIDDKDYYKHMKNFHQLDVNNMPIPQQKSKRKCRSCCKQCRGGNCSSVKKPRATSQASNLIFRINMRDNIKDRWSRMVSQQINGCPAPDCLTAIEEAVHIKPDPDAVVIKTEPDLTDLLSQVEVKIKTEPDDYYE